jgi:hypothetical protein
MARKPVPADATPGEPAELPATSKVCESCTEVRSLSTFARSSFTDDGRAAVCRKCTG